MSKRYLIHPWVLVYCVNRRLAGEDRGTRDLVAGDGRPPDVDLNTGVVARISTREAHGRGLLRASTANNVQLSTFHVELSTRVVASAMKSKHLSTQKVLAGLNALGDFDLVATLAIDDALSAPGGAIKTVFLNLEPAVTNTRVGCGIVDLLQVSHGRTLVAAVHDIVGSRALTVKHVAPDGSDLRTSLDGDHLVGGCGWVRWTIAGNRVRGHILDRAVVRGNSHTITDAVVDAIDLEGDKDSVRAGSTNESKGSEELHDDGLAWRRESDEV